jgi:DNA helicase-2/ATP-dependent DNA helicase PcrA
MTRAKERLYVSHAWQRATRRAGGNLGFMAEPSRFLLEIPADLMSGPKLERGGASGEASDRPLDLDLVFGRRAATRFGTAIRAGGGAYREGSGRPGAPRAGEAFRPSRDLSAKREAFANGARSGSLGAPSDTEWEVDVLPDAWDAGDGAAQPPVRQITARPVVPGERQFRDGDRVRHVRWGDGIVVTSRLTRSDEEVTVAFRDPMVGRKTLLASLANLELNGAG